MERRNLALLCAGVVCFWLFALTFGTAQGKGLRIQPAVQAQEDQVSLTALSEGEVIDQLRRAQVDTLSPLEALNLLYELKKKLN